MNSILNQLVQLFNLLKANAGFALMLVLLLWLVHGINWAVHHRLNSLGIYPRSLRGLVGVICSPFLHGDFNHLFFNSVPLFVLADFILLEGKPQFYCVTAVVVLLSGVATWIFGRRAYHVGASSLIMGYFGYLIAQAYAKPGLTTILLVVVTIYYFGGLVMALVPTDKTTSWEGHVFGFLSGLGAVYLCPIIFSYMG